MKNAAAGRLTRLIFTLLVLCVPGVANAQLTFSGIVVFGTSVSDPGNAYALLTRPVMGLNYTCSVTQSLPPYATVVAEDLYPCAPYAIGGHRFSDGETWIEQFAARRGLAIEVGPAFQRSNGKARNYAVSGARATVVAGRVSLPQQVDAFLTDVGGTAPADALYVIEIGNNDVGDALKEFIMVYVQTGDMDKARPAAQTVISGALTSIAGNIQALYAAGARKFLVLNAAKFNLVPVVTLQGAQAIALGGALSDGFNAGLVQNVLMPLSAALPGIQIAQLDLASRMVDIINHAGNYGLTNVSGFCITPNVAPFKCEQPSTFFFWDGIHPTNAVHAIIAQAAAGVLASYPAP